MGRCWRARASFLFLVCTFSIIVGGAVVLQSWYAVPLWIHRITTFGVARFLKQMIALGLPSADKPGDSDLIIFYLALTWASQLLYTVRRRPYSF